MNGSTGIVVCSERVSYECGLLWPGLPWTWSVMKVVCCECGLLWTWSIVNVVCNACGMLRTWFVMCVVYDEQVCYEKGVFWT